ncbi:MAG: DUF1822 family protein [Okeania sp. SIO3B3]|nr:DUF1822 family protein [Okeania sp. SIO3B3]
MKNLTEHLEFSVPLTKNAYQQAQKLSREQQEPEKAQKVYRNTLAVYAVNFYLNCMEVETNLEKSDRSNPALRSLLDVADLPVKDWGKLECRPVLPNQKICHIPAESLAGRVGYVVVEIDEEINQAKLLGFANTAPEGWLDISQLNSLEQLIYQLPGGEPIQSDMVNLLDWLKEKYDVGWQAVQELLSPELRPAFRNVELKKQERAKLIDLGIELDDRRVVLIITVQEKDEKTVQVRSQVYPTGEAIVLPPNLKMSILTDTDKVFKEVTAKSNDEFIQYEFDAQLGDSFGIQVALGEASLTEKFRV